MITCSSVKDNDIWRRVGNPVSCRFEMLAKVLQRRGYATQAVVANGALASEFNFNQGFDSYVETWKLKPHGGANPNQADAATRPAGGTPAGPAAGSPPRPPPVLSGHFSPPH